MLKRTFTVVALTIAGLLLGAAAATAAAVDVCLAAGTSGGASSATFLASTGSSLNIGVWVMIGIAVLAVGTVLTLVGRAQTAR